MSTYGDIKFGMGHESLRKVGGSVDIIKTLVDMGNSLRTHFYYIKMRG